MICTCYKATEFEPCEKHGDVKSFKTVEGYDGKLMRISGEGAFVGEPVEFPLVKPSMAARYKAGWSKVIEGAIADVEKALETKDMDKLWGTDGAPGFYVPSSRQVREKAFHDAYKVVDAHTRDIDGLLMDCPELDELYRLYQEAEECH